MHRLQNLVDWMEVKGRLASHALKLSPIRTDGRTDGRKRFGGQLNNSKTVRYVPYVSMGSS